MKGYKCFYDKEYLRISTRTGGLLLGAVIYVI
jgi:hypothetical protein